MSLLKHVDFAAENNIFHVIIPKASDTKAVESIYREVFAIGYQCQRLHKQSSADPHKHVSNELQHRGVDDCGKTCEHMLW